MKASHVIFLIFTYLFMQAGTVQATIRLPQLIADGMVLQRNAELRVWGWASPLEKVKIKFHGMNWSTKANAKGEWAISMPKMPAGGPFSMEITGENRIVLNDILIGDVWFCSGQSNMTIKMERVKEKYPEEIAGADFPDIRYFFVPTVADVQKEHTDLPPGNWTTVTKENILNIGTVAYFFAKKLYTNYHIPIGIINSSVGGTPIQAWIGKDSLEKISDYATRLNQFKDSLFMAHAFNQKSPATDQQSSIEADKGLAGEVKWFDSAFVPKNWHKFWLPGYWADQGVRGLNGVIWFRKEIVIPAGMAGRQAKLFLGRIVDADETYVNGRLVGTTTYQYPPRRYEIPPGLLKQGKNIITVRLTSSAGKGGFVPDKRYELTDDQTSIDLRGDWTYQVGQVFPTENRKSALTAQPFVPQNEPTGLYNTMVAPILNFAVKGFIWYQGESNVGTAHYYRLLKTLINSWRTAWKEGDLPFLIVQLPNYGDVQYSPAESGWAEIREAQLQAAALPNAALAVTIDLGEWNDIHPLDKKDVGNRLAVAAERLAYGNQKVVGSGPIFQSATVEGDHMIIKFSSVGRGLASKNGEPLSQFAIAGADKHFVWADATIEGDSIIVRNQVIQHPMYVRYAWADNPEGANLVNVEGLPASPFRTDGPNILK